MRSSVASLAVRHPIEAVYRLLGQLEQRRVDADRQAARGAYAPDPDWETHLREHLGERVPLALDYFETTWRRIEERARGLRVESHDGDAALARAAWMVVRAMGARRAAETGVARGVSSSVILEALTPVPEARLWSIDLPLLSEEWAPVRASAVPEEMRHRWTYLRGPSRVLLPKLLRRIAPIDLFVQDSRSTVPTATFEFDTAWAALRPGGFLIANSVDRSLAFSSFVKRVRPRFALTARFDRKPGLFGIASKG